MNELTELRNEIEAVDREMAALFEKRMECSAAIAGYKKKNNMPVLDSGREKELLEKNEGYVKDEKKKSYYLRFMKEILAISKDYQHDIIGGGSDV
ncbi:MAG: chorismate mutase [Lachnospiraceae bacterium]|nr:chorismate mutase [Lachnospiraceae bacterium]